MSDVSRALKLGVGRTHKNATLHYLPRRIVMLNLDNLIIEFDQGLRTLFGKAHSTRPFPDAGLTEATLNEPA